MGRIPTDIKFQDALQLLQKQRLSAQPIGSPSGSWQTVSQEQKGLRAIEGQNAYKARRGASTEPYGVFWLEIEQVLADGNVIVRNLHERGKRSIQKVRETIEPNLIHPLVAGGDIERWGAKPTNYLLVSQDPKSRQPYPEPWLREHLPRTYGYLTKFRDALLTRGSRTVRELAEKTAFYAMYGIGEYTVAPYKVVWKRMANDIVAAVISQHKTPLGYKMIIPSDTTAIFSLKDEAEAHYLCAVINSTPVREFVKSYSSAGRGFGAPSVMNHIGIPKFNPKDSRHRQLAEISKKLHERKKAEEGLGKLEAQVDDLVKKLFRLSR